MKEQSLFQHITAINWGWVLTIVSYVALAGLFHSIFLPAFPQPYVWIILGYLGLVGLPYAIYWRYRPLWVQR